MTEHQLLLVAALKTFGLWKDAEREYRKAFQALDNFECKNKLGPYDIPENKNVR